MREFTTAVQAEVQNKPEDLHEFKLDGQVMRYRFPQDGQLVVLMAAFGRNASIVDRVAGAIDFFTSILDEPSRTHIVNRLLDINDPFGVTEVEEIMEAMVEEFTGRPITPPSVSTRSQRSGGRRSTRTTPAST